MWAGLGLPHFVSYLLLSSGHRALSNDYFKSPLLMVLKSRICILIPCFSKCGPYTNYSRATLMLLKNADSWLLLWEWRALKMGIFTRALDFSEAHKILSDVCKSCLMCTWYISLEVFTWKVNMIPGCLSLTTGGPHDQTKLVSLSLRALEFNSYGLCAFSATCRFYWAS